MMLEHLCKCNNCGNILYDENPQSGAEKYNIEIINKIIYPMELLNDGTESFWGCGECETDEFLIDL